MFKIFRKVGLFIMAIASAAACTHVDTEKYQQAILQHLNEKYNKVFYIKEMYQEFEGDSGMSVRATCICEGDLESFTVMCYFDPYITNEKIEIDGEENSISDDYSHICFQQMLTNEMASEPSGDIFVRCKVEFALRNPDVTEMARGMDYCLADEEMRSYVSFFIVASDASQVEMYRKQAETLLTKYSPNTGYVYCWITSDYDESKIAKLYKDNLDFGSFLESTKADGHVEFTLYKSQKGLQDRKVIKE